MSYEEAKYRYKPQKDALNNEIPLEYLLRSAVADLHRVCKENDALRAWAHDRIIDLKTKNRNLEDQLSAAKVNNKHKKAEIDELKKKLRMALYQKGYIAQQLTRLRLLYGDKISENLD